MSSQGGDVSSQGGDVSSQGGDVSSDQEEPSTAETQNGQLMPEPCRLSLDPETASSWLLLSEDQQKITVSDRWLNYPDNPQRFNGVLQVLCREGLSGRHRFDVDWMSADNRHAVGVALAYRSVPRKGTLRAPFGCNAASWFFAAERDALRARHDGQEWSYDVPDDGYDRVRVCLDHDGGVLSFYLLSQGVLRHVHTFRAKFTQPLHPGLCAGFTSSFAAFC